MSTAAIAATLPFEEAALLYLQQRTIDVPGRRTGGYIARNTEVSYAQYVDSLTLFFKGRTLAKIHIGNLREYQRARLLGQEPFIRPRRPKAAPAPSPVQPKKVNQELGLLKLILLRANAWTKELQDSYEPLLEPEPDIPRALTPEQQQHWLQTAASRPEFALVYWYSIVAIDTLMSTDEMRALRLGDCNLLHRTITVQRGKCRRRARTIQLANADVLWALEQLMLRAEQCGARDYRDCLFPFRHGREWDVTRPMTSSGLKKPWNAVRAASGLTWFRPYDPRHTGITRLAEAGVPIAVIKDRAGHLTDKMSAHYTHVSESVQRQWMAHAGGYRVGGRPLLGQQAAPPDMSPPRMPVRSESGLARWGTQIPQHRA